VVRRPIRRLSWCELSWKLLETERYPWFCWITPSNTCLRRRSDVI